MSRPDGRFSAGTLLLIAGDILVFLIFSIAGRADHEMSLSLIDTLKTAMPFILGWFITAPLMGAYRPEAVENMPAAAKKAAATMVIATIVGLLLRALYLQRGVNILFGVITLGFNLVLMVIWRVAYTGVKNRKTAAS
ncbi:MAG: DUF3054 domain-containing protein [Bacillaceae bacterium]|nr:DUF3054 domain-containing protein [Bacillaceae bacterium]